MLLGLLFSYAALSGPAHADLPALREECFKQNKGRSCVSLGTTLWQKPESREEARQAFAKGCELKIESACALKKLKAPAKPENPGAGKAPVAKEKTPIKGISKLSPTKYKVSRSAALSYAGDLENTLSTAKMEADALPGGPVRGYRFVEIESGGVFQALGFVLNDIVTHVNGSPITSPSQATAMIPSLAYKDDFAVKLIRGGKTVTFDYQLTD